MVLLQPDIDRTPGPRLYARHPEPTQPLSFRQNEIRITRAPSTMEHADRPPAPTVIDVTVERDRIAALERLHRRLEVELDRTPPGFEYAAMAGQLRETINAIADARNRIYEALIDEEP
ncbi:hypothetical protein KO481_34655 [Nocardia sp. NEAU-G5]|uniref:Uncharacterized protein n=1 Tax=Nocardia albiluteola TaxID=2842303 RepID=A0ABS6BA72_9NOCA|nr:hypothetical protein [Nocardia albiluteola]MBU3066646.1 hypothetical protein [Nocardia albiluteola]